MSKESKGYKNMPKKIYIRTFGCQMNAHDSEIVSGMLKKKGYRISDTLEKADIILFNTCSVRAHAEARAWGKMLELKQLKAQSPKLKLGIIGCMAQNYKEKIFKKLPHVDLVCGTSNIFEIPHLLDRLKDEKRIVAANKKQRDVREKIEISKRESTIKAFVSIMMGCNNYCSYCIVPYVRGPEVSRPVNIIVDEITALVDDGVKEVMLLGQNVNSYNQKGGFVSLLNKINKVKGLDRIRFMTSHPKDASLDLFRAIRGLDKVCEHLHLPLQSGSDRILKLMNRGYSNKQYLKKITDLRKIAKDCSITTDVIVGFPSETDRDFKKTFKLMKEIEFDSAFVFKYSPRKGTKSAMLEDDVSDEVKRRRNQELLELQGKMTKKKNEAMRKKVYEVLVEDINKKSKSEFIGRTRNNKLAVFNKNGLSIGDLASLMIKRCSANTLIGELIES